MVWCYGLVNERGQIVQHPAAHDDELHRDLDGDCYLSGGRDAAVCTACTGSPFRGVV